MGETMTKRICLNTSVLEFMAAQLTPQSRVLEFGSGWSSRWFAEQVRRDLAGSACAWYVCEAPATRYIGAFLGQLPPATLYDLVLVDCLEALRYFAAIWAWTLTRRGGWIVFDDAQRPRHKSAVEWLTMKMGTSNRLVWQPGDIETAKERLALAWRKE
jgi:predicted O-methyltransferase YrrM